MAPCVCIGGGGGCSVAPTTTDQYLTAFGYPPSDPNDPNAASIEAVLTQSVPPGQGNVTAWKALARACLIARALLYCKSTPGDCSTTPAGVKSALGGLQTAGQVAGLGISTGSNIASLLGLGSSAAIGVATLGAGLGLSVILGVLEHHAQAEQTQATVLCNLCPQFSAGIQAVDNAVASGQITPAQAQAYLLQLAQQFKNAVAPYTKSCNAFCGYGAIMSAQATYASYLYARSSSPALPGITGLRVASLPAQNTNVVLAGTYPSPLNSYGASPLVSANPLSPSAPETFYGYAPPGSYEALGSQTPSLGAGNFLSEIPVWLWVLIGAIVLFSFSEGRRAEAAA